ncbi:helix-turn-helix domain-containing protein [Streptomyces sp. HC307]|uniref:helix-turn-helix domain-containing protein n=1 Tax=Streptomyces flavusporus TaxID=3385496 RepID=UPI0039172277
MKKFRPRPGFVVQAYRFALDPNATQEAALRSHCGAARGVQLGGVVGAGVVGAAGGRGDVRN